MIQQVQILSYFLMISLQVYSQSMGVPIPSDSTLIALMKEYHIPALGIGSIENNKITCAKVLGELQKGVIAPENTIFQVASLTKPITEITTLRLVSKGLWSLDEPLAKYWIDPDVKDDPNHAKLTARHVISHQTGFVNWRWLHKTGKLTFDFTPGTHTGYSGEGLEYLKKALEAKFNLPFDKIVRKYLFRPDNMKDSHFFWDSSVNENRYAVGHTMEGTVYDIRKNTEASAADLLMTTIQDYTHFAHNVLKRKNIKKDIWEDMITIQAPEQNSRFGLGWEVFNHLSNDEFALVHSGSDPGVRTIVILLPKSKRGLVLFTNSDNGMALIAKLISLTLNVGDELIAKSK